MVLYMYLKNFLLTSFSLPFSELSLLLHYYTYLYTDVHFQHSLTKTVQILCT